MDARKERGNSKGTLIQAGLSVVVALTLLLGLTLPGCGAPAQQEEQTGQESDAAEDANSTYTFTDSLGFEVTVDNPKRVVACMGSFADIWLLAGGELVGATDDAFESYLEPSDEIAMVGDFSAPNLEEIIALEPDFVLMTAASTGRDGAANQSDLREGLVQSGITVAYFDVTVFEDYLAMLKICSAITGRDDLYEQNGTNVAERIAAVLEKVPTEETPPTVLLMTTYSGGTRVQNSKTMTGVMLSELGANNLADSHPSLLKDFSLESVIELNPNYIFVVPMGNSDEAALKNLEEATAAHPAWATLSAVQNDRYITLNKELFLYKPNNSWDKSYQTLLDYLYAK